MLKFYIKVFFVMGKAVGELSCKQTCVVEILPTVCCLLLALNPVTLRKAKTP